MTIHRYRDRLPKQGEGKQPRAEVSARVEGTTATVRLYDVIDSWGGYWGVSAGELAATLDELPDTVDTINLRINSPGGEVFEAIAMKNLLAAHGARVVAIVDGLAASAASFIAVSADEVVMGENTEMMIHDASAFAGGNAADFEEFAGRLHAVSDNIASMYAAKSGGDLAAWRDLMRAETWYGPEAALEAGLIDRVGALEESDDVTDSVRKQWSAALDVIRGKAGVPSTDRSPTNTHTEDKTKQQAARRGSAMPVSSATSGSTETKHTSHEGDTEMRMSIEEREARITTIDARLADIDNAHAGDVLTAEAQEEWDTLSNEREGHELAIKAQRDRTAALTQKAANPAALEGPTSQRPAFHAPAAHIKPENIYDTAAIRKGASSLRDVHQGYRDNAKRAVDAARFPGATDVAASKERVTRLLDNIDGDVDHIDNETSFLAQRVLQTGAPSYNDAFGKAIVASARGVLDPRNALSPDEIKALSLGVDADGGYAVPFELDPTIMLTSDGTSNPMRQLSRVVSITGKKWEGLTSAGITVTRKAEAAQATDDSPDLDQPVVDTSRADGFVPFTIALEMSWADLASEMTTLLAEAKDDEESVAFVTGDGTAIAGGGTNPQGILTGLVAAGAGAQVRTASATALTLADLRKAKSALGRRFRANAQWLAEDSFYDLADSLITDVNSEDINGATSNLLLGRTRNEASSMPDVSGALVANKQLAIYGNIARAFIIVDRVGMSVELIPTIFGANGRPTGQRGIFAYWFNGSKVINAAAAKLLLTAAA